LVDSYQRNIRGREDENRANVWNVMIFFNETRQMVYVSHNTEVHSHKHCCHGKAISII